MRRPRALANIEVSYLCLCVVICVRVLVCMCVFMCVRVHVCVCICVLVGVWACVRACVHACGRVACGRVGVCGRVRERERERESVCGLCVVVHAHTYVYVRACNSIVFRDHVDGQRFDSI